jgi:hypothetical protein
MNTGSLWVQPLDDLWQTLLYKSPRFRIFEKANSSFFKDKISESVKIRHSAKHVD